MASSNCAKISSFELDEVQNLAGRNIKSDDIVNLDQRVWITDGSAIVRNKVRNALWAGSHFLDAAKLVFCFLGGNLVEDKSALDVIQQTEVVSGLFNGDDIHESSWIIGVSSDLAIDLDGALHDNLGHLGPCQGVLEPIAEHDNQRQGLPKFVGTGGWPGCEHAAELVQHP